MGLDISQLFNGRDLTEDTPEKGKTEKRDKSETVDEKYLSKSSEILPPQKHQLHFRKEKRRGKVVTMVGVFQLQEREKKELLKSLKKSLSTGGTERGDYLEFQGEISDRLKVELQKREFRFKK
jgi:translation initiation factor 1